MILLYRNSGSMAGSRIQQCIHVIQWMLRSLPDGSYFNSKYLIIIPFGVWYISTLVDSLLPLSISILVFGFGSRYEKLFDNSQQLDQSTLLQATIYLSTIKADLGIIPFSYTNENIPFCYHYSHCYSLYSTYLIRYTNFYLLSI